MHGATCCPAPRPECEAAQLLGSTASGSPASQPHGTMTARVRDSGCWRAHAGQRAIAASCSAALQAAARRGDKPDGRSASLCVKRSLCRTDDVCRRAVGAGAEVPGLGERAAASFNLLLWVVLILYCHMRFSAAGYSTGCAYGAPCVYRP